jgi:hypothetical protein
MYVCMYICISIHTSANQQHLNPSRAAGDSRRRTDGRQQTIVGKPPFFARHLKHTRYQGTTRPVGSGQAVALKQTAVACKHGMMSLSFQSCPLQQLSVLVRYP